MYVIQIISPRKEQQLITKKKKIFSPQFPKIVSVSDLQNTSNNAMSVCKKWENFQEENSMTKKKKEKKE